MRVKGKNKNLCWIPLHPTKESGLCSVGDRKPSRISGLRGAITVTSPEVGVLRVTKKAD